MKLIHIGIILFILSLISCGDNSVTIPKEEYEKLTKDTLSPKYPKPFELFNYDNGVFSYNDGIFLGSDGHEYLVTRFDRSRSVEHYIDCVKCIERSKIKDSIKNKNQ
jgi:hypothetical protein